MKRLRQTKLPVLPIYPLLFGLFPVLYLWNSNRAQQPAYVVVPSLLVSLISILALYLVMLALLRNLHRAALLTMLVSLYVLSYGHFHNLLEPIVTNHVLLPLSALFVLGLVIFCAALRFGSPTLTRALNVVSAALILFQLVSAVPYYLSTARQKAPASSQPANSQPLTRPQHPGTGSGEPLEEPVQRDVYFILLDNYGREDILREASGFDNSELVTALKERGFILPDCAQGNYFATAPAISSILNMNYLDQLGIKESTYITRKGYPDMKPLFQESEVIRKFRAYGYHVVTFRGFMGMMDIQNTDTYISFEKDVEYSQRLETANFEDLYFKTTLFYSLNVEYKLYPDLILDKAPFLAELLPDQELLEPRFYQVYLQNLYAFDALQNIPLDIQSPKFVYAHIYAAHWPFMFRPDGELRLPFTEKMTTEGYVDGVKYTNSRILDVIDSILENSAVEPVIILQGDHSNGWEGKVEWSGKNRLKILSAYYLPDGGDQLLYPDITPVNNFRLVFKHYFVEPISLLPDVSHYLNARSRTSLIAPLSCISHVAP